MGNCLARFHDADDSCLRFIVAICCDSFVSLLVFFFGFFGLDLVDFDAVFEIGEIQIYGEYVAVVNISASRCLGQHSMLGAGE